MKKTIDVHVRLDLLRKRQLEKLMQKFGLDQSGAIRQAISKWAAEEGLE